MAEKTRSRVELMDTKTGRNADSFPKGSVSESSRSCGPSIQGARMLNDGHFVSLVTLVMSGLHVPPEDVLPIELLPTDAADPNLGYNSAATRV